MRKIVQRENFGDENEVPFGLGYIKEIEKEPEAKKTKRQSLKVENETSGDKSDEVKSDAVKSGEVKSNEYKSVAQTSQVYIEVVNDDIFRSWCPRVTTTACGCGARRHSTDTPPLPRPPSPDTSLTTTEQSEHDPV